MERLLLTLVIIFISLIAGYTLRQWASFSASIPGEALASFRLRIQKIAMFGLIPVSAMLSLWGLSSPSPQLICLPALGLASWISGGVLALLFSSFLKLTPAKTGSMYCCGSFSNIGAVGSFVCVMQFGEASIAMASLYRIFEEMFYFGIAIPFVRHFSSAKNIPTVSRRLRIDPALAAVLLALSLGLALNLAGVHRPAIFGTLASGAMLAGTICFLFSIGMGLRLSSLGMYVHEAAAISLIKFALVPAIVTSLAMLAHLQNVEGGLPLRVVAVLSAMPVAMNALIPPSLFNLDLDLANACWIFTTLALIVILPIIMIILPLL